MEKIFEIIKDIEEDIDSSYCLGYDNNELTLDSAKESLEYLKEQLKLYGVVNRQGTVKTIDFDKAKEFMINYMNVDRETKNVVSMAYYTKRVTVKEFFEIMENAFKKAQE